MREGLCVCARVRFPLHTHLHFRVGANRLKLKPGVLAVILLQVFFLDCDLACAGKQTHARHDKQKKSEQNRIGIPPGHSRHFLCSQTTSDKMAVMVVNAQIKQNNQKTGGAFTEIGQNRKLQAGRWWWIQAIEKFEVRVSVVTSTETPHPLTRR